MHMLGEPGTMQQAPTYTDVVSEVIQFLQARIQVAQDAGVAKDKLWADPGIGFGKTLAHNVALFRALERFHDLDVQLLMGASRKRFIGALDRDGDAEARIGGSLAAALRAQSAGWHAVRVHDVAQTRQALAVAEALAMPDQR